MTRFIYISDTHLGANPMGFEQQRGYPHKTLDILAALSTHLTSGAEIDFILHGGDMVDSATQENIEAATKAFNLAAPVYLSLGNHDLTTPNAIDIWMDVAPQFFANASPNYTIATDDCLIHVAPNHWCDEPFYWSGTQDAHLSAEQVSHLSRELRKKQDLPHIILTHSSVYGLPSGQTGMPNPVHAPNESFTTQMSSIAAKHRTVKCILGGHNHLNMRIDHEGVEFVTVSSLIETPFEFKLFEVTDQRIEMKTLSLREGAAFESTYNDSKSFVQGRDIDRSFARELN